MNSESYEAINDDLRGNWRPSDTGVYVSRALAPFARDCGYDRPPFRWNDERPFLIRCELDAAFFHLYRIGREDVDYVMETFPIVKRDDVKRQEDYRTRRTILEIYDAMQKAIETGEAYSSRFDPPPADPRVACIGMMRGGQ